MIGAPPRRESTTAERENERTSAIFFSDPYEAGDMHAEEVYGSWYLRLSPWRKEMAAR